MAQARSAAASTDTVTVACKQPNGLILNLYTFVDEDVPVMGGGVKTEKHAVKIGEPVVLYGTALRFGQQPDFLIVGGYALTPNVSAEFMEEWMKQNRDSPLVKNSIVFVNPEQNSARAEAREKKDLKSGLEPIRIDADGALVDKRAPKNIKVAEENRAKPLVLAE